MRILFDQQAFVAQTRGGISRWYADLFRHLCRIPGVELTLLVGAHANVHLREVIPELLGARARWCPCVPRVVRAMVDRLYFAGMAPWTASDIYHPTYYRWPRWPVTPRVITVFDMIHERRPDLYDPGRDPTAARKKNAVLRADGIVCISNSTRSDLVELYPEVANKVRVVYPGTEIGGVPAKMPDQEAPFFLFVGQRGGYKNFPSLLDAFAHSGRELRDVSVVCFGGSPLTAEEQTKIREAGLEGRVHHTTGDDAVLAGLYQKAVALVHPSSIEGFGLPLLEAMTLGCPVIACDAPYSREVTDGAAVMIDCGDREALGKAMSQVLCGGETVGVLRAAGKKRAGLFDWRKSAEALVEFYGEVCRTKDASPARQSEKGRA